MKLRPTTYYGFPNRLIHPILEFSPLLSCQAPPAQPRQRVLDPSLKQPLEQLAELKKELQALTRQIKQREKAINEIFWDRLQRSLLTVRQVPGQASQMQMYLK